MIGDNLVLYKINRNNEGDTCSSNKYISTSYDNAINDTYNTIRNKIAERMTELGYIDEQP